MTTTHPAAVPVRNATGIATAIWLGVSAINFVVWLAVSIISGTVDSPWFLWAFAAGGVVVGGLRLVRGVQGEGEETS